ncbi:MAG TPA: FlgD immunoglobulin-like domain containing protein, partial [Gaiellaceae bacterium]|nr:FlgD immunoglobulin-like domain containing protein [Gaiellaceae bacterium]
AEALVRLGAVTAMGLGSGTPSNMAFDGTLLTRPASGAEPPISDALLLEYNGVYAAPPATDVVSPNGDGVFDTQTFTYKVLTPSQVTATLTGPGGAAATLAQDTEQPGVHSLTWNAQPVVEGAWKFVVAATDAQGRTTTAERDFTVDNTLGSLAVSGLTATYQLAHPAAVTATVETKSGIVVASLFTGNLQPGSQRVAWNGKNANGSILTGSYQVRITATNSIGTASLVAPFTAHRS